MKSKYTDTGLDFEKLILNSPIIKIEYYYSLDDRSNQEEIFTIKADNNKFFKAGELIYKINKETFHNLKDNDHIFFEGLEYIDTDDNIPVYRILQGS